jgi:hypothetical protein
MGFFIGATIFFLNLLDWVFTFLLIRQFGVLEEANPLMRFLYAYYPYMSLYLKVLFSVGFWVLCLTEWSRRRVFRVGGVMVLTAYLVVLGLHLRGIYG